MSGEVYMLFAISYGSTVLGVSESLWIAVDAWAVTLAFSPRGVVRQLMLRGAPNQQAVPAQCGWVRLSEERRYVCTERTAPYGRECGSG